MQLLTKLEQKLLKLQEEMVGHIEERVLMHDQCICSEKQNMSKIHKINDAV
jgi:hypothetical protein